MECREMREQLNVLCDGERLTTARLYAAVAGHWLRCPRCRAAWGRGKRDRRITRHLPSTTVPSGLKDRVLAALPDIEPVPVMAGGRSGRPWLPGARAATGAVLVLLLVTTVPWRGSKAGPAAVEAAVQRANTWHLVGWKLRGGRRVPWEIWGRRSPFFYREQLGTVLNFDDGRQRVRMAATGPNGRMFALRLESGPAPSDMWREWLTMGSGWRNSRAWHETPGGILVFAGSDGGMQGPYSVADTYFTLDKRTWLPVRYEYRQHYSNSKAPAWVAETLQAGYNVPLPDSVTTLRLPPGAVVADTLNGPTDPNIPPPGGSVQRRRGLTVQVSALAMDPDGNILVRIRAWLGNLKLGADGTATWDDVETDIRYRTFGETQDTAYHTEDGRPYVEFQWPHVILTQLTTGDALKLLAPLEPRPSGMALPRSLTLDLQMTPQMAIPGEMSSVLFRQSFLFTVPLPEAAAPIRIDDYLPPGHRQRFRYAPGADNSTLAANIASARAGQYSLENDFDRSIYWQKQGLAALEPYTGTAQFHRLGLAQTYEEAGDARRAAAEYREVIAISRQHPETWSYYAYLARASLKRMATHKPRQWSGKRLPRAKALAHSAEGNGATGAR